MIIDAKDMIVGRLATVVAKKALLGEKIDIVNSEKAIITGKKKFVLDEFKRKKEMGTFKGPFLPRMPDRFLRKMIRGMLPYKQEKGKTAYKRIMCYVGIPEEFKDKEIIALEEGNITKLKNLDYISIKEICKKLGKSE